MTTDATVDADAPVQRALQVEALVSGRLAASSRFRVLQHVEQLRRRGHRRFGPSPAHSKYASLPPSWSRRRALRSGGRLALQGAKLASAPSRCARSWRADVTWLERELLPGHETLERVLHRPVLFDVDDAIWLVVPRARTGHTSRGVPGRVRRRRQ